MKEGIINPLTEGDLEAVAYLCLANAALTDRDQFPPGSGSLICSQLHERRNRFIKAQERVKEGITLLLELGLSHEDCSWAASQAHLAKDQEGWLSRFQTATNELKQAAECTKT